MIDFSYLEKLIEKKTPGPWRILGVAGWRPHWDAIGRSGEACGIHVYGPHDSSFITAMGTLAPSILAVLKAADSLYKSMHTPQNDTVHSDVYSLRNCDVLSLDRAMAALHAAVKELEE